MLSFDATEQVNDLGVVRVHVRAPIREVLGLNRRARASRAALIVGLGEDSAPRARRTFSGIITEVRIGLVHEDAAEVTLAIRSALALLGYRTSRRVFFEDMTAEEIFTVLLASTGIDFEWRVGHPGGRRRLRIQYDETDLAFIVRLLADEDLSWTFESGPGPRPGYLWESVERMVVTGPIGTGRSPADGPSGGGGDDGELPLAHPRARGPPERGALRRPSPCG